MILYKKYILYVQKQLQASYLINISENKLLPPKTYVN